MPSLPALGQPSNGERPEIVVPGGDADDAAETASKAAAPVRQK
jgi:hypothetical protein